MRHWAAFRLDQTIPFCRAGTPDEALPEGDETTLSESRLDCPDCRRLMGSVEATEAETTCRHGVTYPEPCEACGDELLDEQADRLLRAVNEEGS